jgi:hypothetical protein
MSAVIASNEIEKERGRLGTSRHCLPGKYQEN